MLGLVVAVVIVAVLVAAVRRTRMLRNINPLPSDTVSNSGESSSSNRRSLFPCLEWL